MKRLLMLILIMGLMVSGCGKTSDLLRPETTPKPIQPSDIIATQEPSDEQEQEEPKTKITLSQQLEMTNDWTILGDFNYELTKKGKKDRIVLGTSATHNNGEMMWDDSQYWTVAVISEDGAYNLFAERIRGNVYFEINECFMSGVNTPIVTVYIFSGNDREIRNYIFDGEAFTEEQEYTTKNFSTGGINNMYSSMPQYKPN